MNSNKKFRIVFSPFDFIIHDFKEERNLKVKGVLCGEGYYKDT